MRASKTNDDSIQKKWILRVLLFLLTLSIISYYKLFWLAGIVMGFSFIYLVGSYLCNKIKKVRIKVQIKVFFGGLLVLFVSVTIKLFVLDVYRIPSNSMRDSLFSGDIIIVNKLIYGPKLPQSVQEVPWLNLFFTSKEIFSLDKKPTTYKRLKGIGEINRGDILVFKQTNNFSIVKRIVAVSGDTIQLVKGGFRINGEKANFSNTIRNEYRFKVLNRERFLNQINLLRRGYPINNNENDQGFVTGDFSIREIKTLEEGSSISKAMIVRDTIDIDNKFYTRKNNLNWIMDDFGPVIVPRKGMKIDLNPTSFKIYSQVITKHEGQSIILKHDQFFDEKGKRIYDYSFKQNYYFVLGDNRNHSVDSRVLGFIPETKIVGQVSYIIFPSQAEIKNRPRFFKKVDHINKVAHD